MQKEIVDALALFTSFLFSSPLATVGRTDELSNKPRTRVSRPSGEMGSVSSSLQLQLSHALRASSGVRKPATQLAL